MTGRVGEKDGREGKTEDGRERKVSRAVGSEWEEWEASDTSIWEVMGSDGKNLEHAECEEKTRTDNDHG